MFVDVVYRECNGSEIVKILLEIDDFDSDKLLLKSVCGVPLKKMGFYYYIHCEEGEAVLFRDNKHVAFYHEGIRSRIEYLPWSDEAKMMAKMRYGECDGKLKYSI